MSTTLKYILIGVAIWIGICWLTGSPVIPFISVEGDQPALPPDGYDGTMSTGPVYKSPSAR